MMNWKEDELLEAVTQRDIAGVRAALKKGARVDHAPPEARGAPGKSLLHHAAAAGDVAIFRELSGAGGRGSWTLYRGNTPLHVAAAFNRVELVKWCVENGADVNTPGENGYTCLHIAAKHGFGEMLAFLLDNGGRADAVARDQKTPAALAKNEEIRDLLASSSVQNFAADEPRGNTFKENDPPPNPIPQTIRDVPIGYAGSIGVDGRAADKRLGGQGAARAYDAGRGGADPWEGPSRGKGAMGAGSRSGAVAGLMNQGAQGAMGTLDAQEGRRQGKAGLGARPIKESPLNWGNESSPFDESASAFSAGKVKHTSGPKSGTNHLIDERRPTLNAQVAPDWLDPAPPPPAASCDGKRPHETDWKKLDAESKPVVEGGVSRGRMRNSVWEHISKLDAIEGGAGFQDRSTGRTLPRTDVSLQPRFKPSSATDRNAERAEGKPPAKVAGMTDLGYGPRQSEGGVGATDVGSTEAMRGDEADRSRAAPGAQDLSDAPTGFEALSDDELIAKLAAMRAQLSEPADLVARHQYPEYEDPYRPLSKAEDADLYPLPSTDQGHVDGAADNTRSLPDTMEPLPDPGDDEGGQAGFGGSAGLGMAVSGRDMSNLYGNATMKGMRVSGSAMSGAVGGTPRLPARQIVRGSGGGGGQAMESLFSEGMGDIHPSRAQPQFGRRASAAKGGAQRPGSQNENREQWDGNTQRRTGPMQEDVVTQARDMAKFVSQRMQEMPTPTVADPGRSQWAVDQKPRAGRRAAGDGDTRVDPRYGDAVRKERLAMEAVMEQRRKMADWHEANAPRPPSGSAMGRNALQAEHVLPGTSHKLKEDGTILSAGIPAGRVRDNKAVDPISGESFFTDGPAGSGARGTSNILLHDVMYTHKLSAKAAGRPAADPRATHPALKSTRPW